MTADATPRRQPPVGMKDVARRAGVSLGTVSNVLNHPDRVAPGSLRKVQAAIDDLGFIRNESARQLRAGSSRVVAYLVLDLRNPFFADVASGAEEVIAKDDLALLLCNSNEDVGRERSYVTLLEQQRIRGLLITPVDGERTGAHWLRKRGTPVVYVDRIVDDVEGCSVSVDDHLGGSLAVAHLLELGHTRIAYVGGPADLAQVSDRRAGAHAAIAARGLPPESLVEIETHALTTAAGRLAGQRLLGLPAPERPTAAFCANDLVALGLLQQIISTGRSVPKDLAIVGYDDIEFAAAAAVPLTSVRQPRRRMGRRAARLLLDESNNPDHVHERVVLKPELIVRRSTDTVG